MALGDKVSLKKDSPDPRESVTEVWTLVRDYAKQETVDPLKGLVGFLKWGVPGAILIGLGVIQVLIACMRAFQAEGPGVFDGGWSFVPYVAALVVAAVVLGVTAKAMFSTESPT